MTQYFTRATRRGAAVGAAMAAFALGALLVWGTSERDTPAPATERCSIDPDAASPLPDGDPAPTQTQTAEPSMRLWRVVDEHAAAVKPSYPADWSEAGRALVDVSDAAVTAIGWQLEAGFWDSQGALGNGTGSWRLVVDCEHPIVVMNLLENLTTGHLTNLSPK